MVLDWEGFGPEKGRGAFVCWLVFAYVYLVVEGIVSWLCSTVDTDLEYWTVPAVWLIVDHGESTSCRHHVLHC